MIERRRRERINECLNQLQTLISQLDKDKQKVDVRVSTPPPIPRTFSLVSGPIRVACLQVHDVVVIRVVTRKVTN